MNKIKVGLVEDQKLFRDGLISIINANASFDLLFDVEKGDEMVAWLKQTDKLPDIILLDMSLPDSNGIELNTFIHKEYPSIKTIILTAYDQPRYIVRLIENGANSFLSKNVDAAELVLSIESVHSTGFYFNQTIMQALQSDAGKRKLTLTSINGVPVELTNREMEVLLLICKGDSTEEIADKLALSARTVDGHRMNLLSKTGCKNIAGLVVFAISNHLFVPY